MWLGGGAEPRQLAEQNVRLAYKVAQEFGSCGIEFEDLISICFVGLVKAAYRYDPDSGNAFSTFAFPVIRNEVRAELRKVRRRHTASILSLDEQREDGCLIAEMIPDQRDPFSEIYAADLYKDCMKCLTEREKAVVIPMMFGEETQEQVGARLSMSQSYVSRIYRDAKEKMRKVI